MSDANYSVIRYVPDPGRGESLNIGILVWAGDEFRLNLDDAAVKRVITENPRLDSDSLLYVEPLLNERLSSAIVPVPSRIKTLLEGQRGFPIDLSEPRFTTVDPLDEGGLDATLERLTKRVVRPRRRSGRSGPDPGELLERRLKPRIRADTVTRNHFFEKSKSGVPRKADFFVNSGANVALDTLRLAIQRADEIRRRADAEAFKVYDVQQVDRDVSFFVFCQFGQDDDLADANQNARKVIETQGAKIVTDLDEAVDLLASAAGGR